MERRADATNIKENVERKQPENGTTNLTARGVRGVERGKAKCALLSEAIIAGLKSLKKLRRTSFFANITPAWPRLDDTANGSSGRI